jgi:hypothetical protein
MRFLTAIAFVVLGSSAAVSVVHASPWHYGARIGGGQTNIHGDFPDIADPKYQASFTAGAFADTTSCLRCRSGSKRCT